MTQLINSTHIKQLEGGYVIKQGDYASNFKFKLLDELKNDINDINDRIADIVLCDKSGKVSYTTISKVVNSTVEFYIKERLNPGEYLLEIHAGGYIFPSNNKFKIVVNHISKFESGNQKGGVDKLANNLMDNVNSNSKLPQIVKQNLKYEMDYLSLNYDKYWELVNHYNSVELGKINDEQEYRSCIYPAVLYLISTHPQEELNSTADELIEQLNSIPSVERKLIAESDNLTELKLDKEYSDIVVECICEYTSDDEITPNIPPIIFVDFNGEERRAYIVPNMKFKVAFFANEKDDNREIIGRTLDKISINYQRSNIDGTVKFSNVKVYGGESNV